MDKLKFEIDQPKKFEVTEPDKKKFVIDEPKKFEVKKKFEIENEKPNWFKQENSDDCGPCLILNALAELEIQTLDRDIQSVRNKVNQSRGQSEQLAPGGWFRSTDVGQYLSDAGLDVDEYPVRPYERQATHDSIKQIFDEGSFDFIYITLGRHFRGIIRKEGQLMLLDSFKTGPENITADSAWSLIEDTINVSSDTVMQRVGVVRRGTPGYHVF